MAGPVVPIDKKILNASTPCLHCLPISLIWVARYNYLPFWEARPRAYLHRVSPRALRLQRCTCPLRATSQAFVR